MLWFLTYYLHITNCRKVWRRNPLANGTSLYHFGLLKHRQFQKQWIRGMAIYGQQHSTPTTFMDSGPVVWERAAHELRENKRAFGAPNKSPVTGSATGSSSNILADQDSGSYSTENEFGTHTGSFNLNREQLPLMSPSQFIRAQQEQEKSRSSLLNGNGYATNYPRPLEVYPSSNRPSVHARVNSTVSTLEKKMIHIEQKKIEPDTEKDWEKEVNGHDTINSRVELFSKQPEFGAKESDLRKRLQTIYGKVLVVDSVHVAKEVVRKLTKKYKDLVHACDTEV